MPFDAAPSLEEIVSASCKALDVSWIEFAGRARQGPVSDARALCVFLCRKHATASYPAIAVAMGKRGNNRSVVDACQRAAQHIAAGEAAWLKYVQDAEGEIEVLIARRLKENRPCPPSPKSTRPINPHVRSFPRRISAPLVVAPPGARFASPTSPPGLRQQPGVLTDPLSRTRARSHQHGSDLF